MVESEKNILSPIWTMGRIVLVIGFSFLILTLFIIFSITSRLTKPIKQLRKSINSVNLNNLALQIKHLESNNELILLNESFDAMFLRLKTSMDEVVQLQAQELKAHMLALQSQMNPHFLYNTLSTISSAGQEAGSKQVMEMCHKLSNMLRYSTAYSERPVKLKNEVENAENYLKLMKDRYEDRFSYDIVISNNAILETIVPKLILQPLVENCFEHGFPQVRPPWKLSVFIGRSLDCWYIEVTDNGAGFKDETLDTIKAKAEEFIRNPSSNITDLTIGGLGLVNTYIRLKIIYQSHTIFKIGNILPHGIKITIGGNIQ
jgi:sensor histidine kinase YesM